MHRKNYSTTLLFLTALFAVFGIGPAACSHARRPALAVITTPHHTACVSCHRRGTPEASPGSGAFAGGLDPSEACLDCHHYETGHHPIDVATQSDQQRAEDPLPLYGGRIRCLTCHQAHRGASQNDLAEQPRLLRGGPYADLRQFCYRCHSRERFETIDPHRMLDAGGNLREIDGKPACLFCHAEQPDRAAGPDDVTFQADVAFLCRRCHASMSGSFLDQHFHARPKKDTRRAIRRTEQLRDIALPLAPRDGRITCSTCHNPHQDGVDMRPAARAGADQPKRLRIAKEDICGACHAP